jgi:YVTN family beta-propeller protein
MKVYSRIWCLVFIVLLGCNKKEQTHPVLPSGEWKNGLLVLHEGLFQQNNSKLSWLNLSDFSFYADLFSAKNNRYLGDTANDMAIYGGKIYIVVNASSTVEVLDKHSMQSVAQIPMQFNGQAQQPRKIAFHQNKAFVSSFDGYVNVIDTTSLSVTQRIKVGRNPEGIAVYNDQLYVANSGGLDFPNYDSTVFCIDLNLMQVTDTVFVGANPGNVLALDNAGIFVVKRGNYGSDPSELIWINPSNQTTESVLQAISGIGLSSRDNELFVWHFDHGTQQSVVHLLNTSSRQIVHANLITSADVKTLYGVFPIDSDRFAVCDAQQFVNLGKLLIFNYQGQKLSTTTVALNPNKVIYFP